MGTAQLAQGLGVGLVRRAVTALRVSQATQTRVMCGMTAAARLYQPIATGQQFYGLGVGVSQARSAIESGDYDRAAVALSQAGFNSIGLFGSLRETVRFARAFHGLNPDRIRDYLRACFAAGTPLLGEFGSKAVEQFRPGDRVWARDENDPNGPLELKEVEEIFTSFAPIWHVHLGDQVIRTTAEHPFYVEDKGWVETKELEIGDRLVGRDGELLTVDDLLDTGEWEAVYNLRVADYHTYFVGGDDWAFAVWSHNTCVNPVHRTDANWNPRTYTNARGRQITEYGKPQVTNGPNGELHAARIELLARRLADGMDDAYIVYNRSWGTSTGRITSDRRRPDFVIVERGRNGRPDRVSAYEVRSDGQDRVQLLRQLEAGRDTLPVDLRGEVEVFELRV